MYKARRTPHSVNSEYVINDLIYYFNFFFLDINKLCNVNDEVFHAFGTYFPSILDVDTGL